MTQPTAYVPATDFSAEEAASVSGRSTVRTAMLDAELATIAARFAEYRANLSILQRDDTKLRDYAVEPHALAPAVVAMMNSNITPRGDWLTATAYAQLDLIANSGNIYVCLTAHTSGTFATDLAAAKWMPWSYNLTADPELAAIAGLLSGADLGMHFTGSGSAATHALTPFARTLLDDGFAAAFCKTLAAGNVYSSGIGYALALSHCGQVGLLTGSPTVLVESAATLGAGWFTHLRNVNSTSGTVIVDFSGAELCDHLSTLKLYPGDSCTLVCTGATFYTLGLDRPQIISSNRVPAPVSTLDFTGFDADTDLYECYFSLAPTTDDVFLFLRVATAGLVWQTASGYSWGARMHGPSAGADSGSTVDALDSLICLTRPNATQGVSNAAASFAAGTMRLFRPAGTSYVAITYEVSYTRVDGAQCYFCGAGRHESYPVEGLRLGFSSGNISSGFATLLRHRRPQ